MATQVLHIGNDHCHRIMVLRRAGYSVEACPFLGNLDTALHNDDKLAAVAMSEADASARQQALTLIRSISTAPVILFKHAIYYPDEADFDLVIPNLTPPKDWLNSVAAIIARSRALRAQSKIVRERSATLVRETAAATEKLIELLQRSKEILGNDPENSSSDSEKD